MEEIQQAAEVQAAAEDQLIEGVAGVPNGKNKKNKGSNLRKQENLIGWIYIAPMVIGLVLFSLIPIILSIVSMFYRYDGSTQISDWVAVGGENFKKIFGGMHSKEYWDSFANTLLFAIQLPLGMIIGMFLALGMNRSMRGVQTFRIIYYIPCVMSVVAVTVVWKKLFAQNGIIDNMFHNSDAYVTNPEDQFLWLDSRVGIVITVTLLQIWKGVGYTALMFIAGLQSVSTDQLEAARIDGAGPWTILYKITLPALYPIIFYLLVTGLIGSLQMFNEVYVLTGGVGGYKTAVSFVYYCKEVVKNYGEASVAAWVLAIIIFIVTAIQMYVDKRKREAE